MNKIFGIVQKGIIMFKILLQESFCRCIVVKMSVAYGYNGRLIKSNWGDDINYWFLREIISGKFVNYDWSLATKLFKKSYVSGIGSILTLFNMENGIVWGSGIISSKDNVNGKPKEVRAVRGPLTRLRLLEQGIDCPEVYGDPALLVPRFYTPKVEKQYKLGVIPHYTDRGNPLLNKLKNDEEVLIIDIAHYNHWLDFIDQINQCEMIASTSLHGLIMSEAYSIPNIWIKLRGSELSDDFKFHDFFLSLGYDREPMMINYEITSESLRNEGCKWKKGSLDMQPLVDACPFELKQDYKITR